MSYRIREVDPTDDDVEFELNRLNTLLFNDGSPKLDLTQGYWWLVYDDTGEAVGFAAVKPSYRWLETGYLNRAGVTEAHRGHGLQRRLILVREGKARRLGWKYLLSDTHDNHPSANNLAAMGYRMYDPAHPWSFNSALYWKKSL